MKATQESTAGTVPVQADARVHDACHEVTDGLMAVLTLMTAARQALDDEEDADGILCGRSRVDRLLGMAELKTRGMVKALQPHV